MNASMLGQTLKHYRILEQVGAGGMGVVFRAHDEQLDRDVAVKVLPPGTLADETASRRFHREALALAKLNHPNVATVHEFSHESGVNFLVTEYIPGLGLDAKIAGRPLPQREVIAFGIQLTDGLAAAHECNLVHRDLKPANIRIMPNGRLKIIDFGLALPAEPGADSALTATMTSSQEVTGTLPYMAPEQLRGLQTDVSSDIWAAGTVLYEMATGQRPFREPNGPLLIDAILNKEPASPRTLNPSISPGLENIIQKALVKEPDKRYQTVREMAIDLERLTMGASPLIAKPPGFKMRRWWWRGAGAAALVIIGVLLTGPFRTRIGGLMRGEEERHIAVLPFQSSGGGSENAQVVDGLMDSMTSKLSSLDAGQRSLWIVPASVVRQHKVDDPVAALKDLGATIVVKGSIDRHEQRVHMILDVIETRDLRQIGSVEVENDQGDIASLQNQAVERLAKIMNVSATPEMLRESTGKVAPAAYESYLKALGYMQRYDKPENLDLAINELATAVKKDPHFAVGFAALGEAYRLKYQVEHDAKWIEQATENCKRAQELDDRLSGAYVTLGLIHSDAGKHDLALQEFQKALQMNPRDSDALSGLAHAYENAGRTQEAEAAFKRAAGLRPDYWDGYNSLGLFYDRQRRYGEAIVQMKRAIELTPDNAQAYFNLGALYLDSGDSRNIGDAEAALKKSLSLNPSYPAYANLGYLYLQQNRYAESAAMTEKALQYNARDEIGWENLIIAYSWLKETDKLAAARAKELALIEEKIKLKPQDPLLQANLGQLYATLGQTGNAPRHLEAALALTPNDPTVLITVAEGYEALGERRQALNIVQQALQKGYSMDDLKRDPSLQSLLSDPGFHATAGK